MAFARIRLCLKVNNSLLRFRKFSTSSVKQKKGLVLGSYTGCEEDSFVLTSTASNLDDDTGGKIVEYLKLAGPGLSKGKSRVFYKLHDEHSIIAVVGLGKEGVGFNELEEVDERKEIIRTAAAVGTRALQEVGVTEVLMENLDDAEAAAEGATLGAWLYQESKNDEKKIKIPSIVPFEGESPGWCNGVTVSGAQNFARWLADTPANLMTPTIFAKEAKEALTKNDIKVIAHDRKWAEEKGMGSFLSVTRGSDEPPVFLEMIYNGADDHVKPIVLVGKGVTFDTGGISLKPSKSMDEMRADMGGAACVVGTLAAVSKLHLSVNVVGLIPLCENMPSGKATKPGDVVKAMNGKTICVDNTDAEGRLILADALCYASTFDPLFTLDIATLTGAMNVALGTAATGVFTNSTPMWNRIHKAGTLTGDRVWRFPLWQDYTKIITDYKSVDLNNIGAGRGGGACTAAAFLKEFAPKGDWLHLDIAGVMGPSDPTPYLHKGMTGRPTRTLIQLVSQFGS